jgi:ferredoxin--NADP+ reductase
MADPVLPDVQMNLVRPKEPVIGQLVHSESCMKGRSASFVRHIDIDVSGTPLEGNFRAGQAFGVVPPGRTPDGKLHSVRLYSIASPSWGEDGQGKVLSTTVKRVIDERSADDQQVHDLFLGVCSNWLCDIPLEAEVAVTGPSGKRFLLPANTADHNYVFVATGTGIAPFRGMVKELLEHPDGPCKAHIHLALGVPYGTDLMYDDLFTSLAEQHDNFHYHTAISRPETGKRRYVDRCIVESDAITTLLADESTLLYMCGLKGMEDGIYRHLLELGIVDQYLNWPDDIPRELANVTERKVRAGARCMVEVY